MSPDAPAFTANIEPPVPAPPAPPPGPPGPKLGPRRLVPKYSRSSSAVGEELAWPPGRVSSHRTLPVAGSYDVTLRPPPQTSSVRSLFFHRIGEQYVVC